MIEIGCWVRAVAATGLLLAAGPTWAADAPANKVVVEGTGDLNGDGVADRVQLLQADDSDIDLAIYLSAGGKLPATPTILMPEFGWGDIDGDKPGLKISARGSLSLEFRNDQGRDRWRQITIAFRNGGLMVAGYTYEGRDALNPNKAEACDLNLLTGAGTRNLKAVKFPAGGVPLAKWSDDTVPAPCKFDD